MNLSKRALALTVALFLTASHLSAQSINLPATYLENFELQTNTIMVRGFSLIGSVNLGNSTVAIHANEANDVTHSQKAYGLVVDASRPAGDSGEPSRIFLAVDYDELDSLANALEYISKVTWGVTQLNGFEASYTTRSGFRVIAHSDRRQETVNTFVQFGDGPRMPATGDQLAQLRSLITQAKASLDALK